MGLTFDKILVILIIGLIIVGPERLPGYAKKLGEVTRNVRRMASGAKDRIRDEMGPEFDEVEWQKLDPRQYDPRRIIRDALLEDEAEAQAAADRDSRTTTDRSGAGVRSGAPASASGSADAFDGGPRTNLATQSTANSSSRIGVMHWDEEAT